MAKKLTSNRPTEKVRQSMSNAGSYCEPVMPLSSPEAYEVFAHALGQLPSMARATYAGRALAGEIAETQVSIFRMNGIITRDGEMITDPHGRLQPHPLLAPRHSAGMRLTTLISRAKMMPQNDIREIQRQGHYESALRGHTPLVVPITTNDGAGQPDWESMLKAEEQ